MEQNGSILFPIIGNQNGIKMEMKQVVMLTHQPEHYPFINSAHNNLFILNLLNIIMSKIPIFIIVHNQYEILKKTVESYEKNIKTNFSDKGFSIYSKKYIKLCKPYFQI